MIAVVSALFAVSGCGVFAAACAGVTWRGRLPGELFCSCRRLAGNALALVSQLDAAPVEG